MEEKDLKQIREIVHEEVVEAVEAGNENMAQLMNTAFQGQKDYMDDKFAKIDDEFTEIKDTLRVVEAKINKALNIEYVRLEKRLKVVEQKLGITAETNKSEV